MGGYSEADEALLRRRLRESQEATEAIEKELDLLLKSRNNATGSLFHLKVITDDVPELINPRDTIGAHLIGRRWSDFCFWALYKNKPLGLLIYIICGFCPSLLWLLSVSVDPSFGWAVGMGFPLPLMSVSVDNRELFQHVRTSFEWWAFVILLCISVGTMIDAFALDPPRTFGACYFLFAYGIGSFSDARPLFKRTGITAKILYICWALTLWAGLILWWLNRWIFVRETVIPLGGVVTLNVQSIGFSCFSSVAVLYTRYAWISLRDETGGTMVMIKARVRYLPSKMAASNDTLKDKVIAYDTQTIQEDPYEAEKSAV